MIDEQIMRTFTLPLNLATKMLYLCCTVIFPIYFYGGLSAVFNLGFVYRALESEHQLHAIYEENEISLLNF